jgi:hypothetical protein
VGCDASVSSDFHIGSTPCENERFSDFLKEHETAVFIFKLLYCCFCYFYLRPCLRRSKIFTPVYLAELFNSEIVPIIFQNFYKKYAIQVLFPISQALRYDRYIFCISAQRMSALSLCFLHRFALLHKTSTNAQFCSPFYSLKYRDLSSYVYYKGLRNGLPSWIRDAKKTGRLLDHLPTNFRVDVTKRNVVFLMFKENLSSKKLGLYFSRMAKYCQSKLKLSCSHLTGPRVNRSWSSAACFVVAWPQWRTSLPEAGHQPAAECVLGSDTYWGSNSGRPAWSQLFIRFTCTKLYFAFVLYREKHIINKKTILGEVFQVIQLTVCKINIDSTSVSLSKIIRTVKVT